MLRIQNSQYNKTDREKIRYGGREAEMDKDMTKGPLFPLLIHFTIPLVLGNLLQLTYNAVDSIVVGKYVGKVALAAVGTSNPLMTLIILFIQGICLGAGVLIGTIYGAKDEKRLKSQISTTMIAGLIFSAVMTGVSMVLAPWLLGLLQTDPVIIPEAVLYLRIVFCGLIFNFIYNFFASTLRAMGDSRSPLYFLGISAGINILGDLFFVVVLRMGTAGCAISTVISEGLSCLFCWQYIKKKVPILNLGREWFRFERSLLKETLRYGLVSAMQQSTVQIGKIGIQTIVNTLGVTATAAFSAINRIDDFAYIPEQNIAHAMTSVMAQNRGAGKRERVLKVFRIGMGIEVVYGILAGAVLLGFARPIMTLFTEDAETIGMGMTYLHLIAFMYLLPSLTNGIQGYFRGIGDMKITLWSSMINFLVRVVCCAWLVFFGGMGIDALPWAYLAGWVVMLLYELPYLIRGGMVKK